MPSTGRKHYSDICNLLQAVMYLWSIAFLAASMAGAAFAHSCPYPALVPAYCCKHTGFTIVQPRPTQDMGIQIGVDCKYPPINQGCSLLTLSRRESR